MLIKRKGQEYDYLKTVGKNIKKERSAQRYSQKQMAEEIGYKSGYSLHLIEKGKISTLDILLLRRIATFLEIDIGKLL